MLLEHNVVLKNPMKVGLRFASCYPNLYRTAISSLGFHIIYELLNSREDTWCERIIYPNFRSLESSTPLKSFDIVSFSLQYEQDYVNALEMMEKGGIPSRKENRGDNDPLIIAGGPCATSNPAPMSDFVDLFIIGEAEAVMDQLIDKYFEMDNPRKEIESFLEIEGVYLPDYPAKRVIVDDMAQACHPIHQIVPESDDKNLKPALGSSFLLGVSRGCTRGCRFCMAGYLYRPRRETPLKQLFKIAEDGREATGLNKIALIGAAVSDYSQIDELCSGLLERDFKVTTPSLRIESVSSDTLESLMKSGLKTITLAPESVFCVRKSLNKPISDEKTYEVVKEALSYGLNVKMYFMIGSPVETKENILQLSDLMKNLLNLSKKRNSIRFSVNPLIPKPHTPMQWEGYDLKQMKSKINFLKSNLKNIPLKIESPRTGLIQHVLSTGGPEIGHMIEKSQKDKIPLNEWKKFSSARNMEDPLPWKNIDVGLRDEFLKEEYLKLVNSEETAWCEESKCYNCGSCH